MHDRLHANALRAVNAAARGGVIAFPTESVYSLGCDPHCEKAVLRVCAMKQRSVEQGFIVVVSDLRHLDGWLNVLPPRILARAQATWPGPVTWVFPCSEQVPEWVRGKHGSLAVRVSAHPDVHRLCSLLGGPLISTSANLSGSLPARDAEATRSIFNGQIDYVLEGRVGTLRQPTPIYDIITGEQLRAGGSDDEPL